MSSTTSVFTVITTKLNAGQNAANTGAGAQNSDGSFNVSGTVLGTAQTAQAGIELATLGKAAGNWLPATGLGLSAGAAYQAYGNIKSAWDKNLPINQSDIASLVGSAAGMGGAAIVLMGASGPIMVGVAATALTTSVAAGGYQLYAQAKGLTWDPVAGKTVEIALTAEQRTQIDLHLQQSLPLWNQSSTLTDLELPIGTKFQTTGSVFSGTNALASDVNGAPLFRNSVDYISDTSANDHAVVIKEGGTLSDAWVLQKGSATGFANDKEFYAAVLACNPDITDVNKIPAGTKLMLPERMSDGSITYNYTGGTSVNTNAKTGEYFIITPNSEGGQTVQSRTLNADGTYSVHEASTNATGETTRELNSRQDRLSGDISAVALDTTSTTTDGQTYTHQEFDTEGNITEVQTAVYDSKKGLTEVEVYQEGELLGRSVVEGKASQEQLDKALSLAEQVGDAQSFGQAGKSDSGESLLETLNILDAQETAQLTAGVEVLGFADNQYSGSNVVSAPVFSTLTDYATWLKGRGTSTAVNNDVVADPSLLGLQDGALTLVLARQNPNPVNVMRALQNVILAGGVLSESFKQSVADQLGTNTANVNAWVSAGGAAVTSFLVAMDKPTVANVASAGLAMLNAGVTFSPALKQTFADKLGVSSDAFGQMLAYGGAGLAVGAALKNPTPENIVSSTQQVVGMLGSMQKSASLQNLNYTLSNVTTVMSVYNFAKNPNMQSGLSVALNIGMKVAPQFAVPLAAVLTIGELVIPGFTDKAVNALVHDIPGVVFDAAKKIIKVEASIVKGTLNLAGSVVKVVGGALDSAGNVVGDAIEDVADVLESVWHTLTPLVVNLADDPVHTTTLNAKSPVFDMSGDGVKERTGWITPDEGFLVRDLNGNGQIDDVKEMFSERTSPTASTAFGALTELDSNKDGVIDVNDVAWNTLKVWVDKNSDGQTQANELYTLAQLGIASIKLKPNKNFTYDNGNVIGEKSTFTYTDGRVGEIADAIFTTQDVNETNDVAQTVITQDSTTVRLGNGQTMKVLDVHGKTLTVGAQAEGLNMVASTGGNTLIAADDAKGLILIGEKGDTLDAGKGRVEPPVYGPMPPAVSPSVDDVKGYDVVLVSHGGAKLVGNAKNNLYVVSQSTDVIQEQANAGFDTVRSSASYTLGSHVENLKLTGEAALSGTGNELNNILAGNSSSNTLRGEAGNDVLDGGAGSDDMYGGAGDDTYVVDNVLDKVKEQWYDSGLDTVQSSVSYTLPDYIENLTLTGTDAINATGNVEVNVLRGNGAANTLFGIGSNDTLIGGAGDDTYVIWDASTKVIENANEGTDTVYTYDSYSLAKLPNVENITMRFSGQGNLTGNANNNRLTGSWNSNNVLDGGAGDDYLEGCGPSDVDTLKGGKGNDTYVVDGLLDKIVENAGEGTDTVQSYVSFSLIGLANVENLTLISPEGRRGGDVNATGNALSNVLVGNDANNVLDGGAGNDTLYGCQGNDTYVFGKGSGQDVVDESAGYGSWSYDVVKVSAGVAPSAVTVTGDANGALILSITGTTDKLTLADWYGKGLIEEVRFADGTVWNEAVLKAKVLAGTAGSDYQRGAASADVITGLAGNDYLLGAAGNDSLNGGAGNDYLYGGEGDDTYVFGKGSGQDVVDESGGSAVRAGGGIDTIQLSAGVLPSGVVVTRDRSGALYLSITGTTDKLTLTDWYGKGLIEQVKFADGTVWNEATLRAKVLAGTAGDDYQEGQDSADVITGQGGNDTLYGLKGNDTLNGGAGSDTLYGGQGSDTYVFERGAGQDLVLDEGGDADDAVQLGAGIAPSDVVLTRDQGGLYLSIKGTQDKLTLQGWFSQPYRVEQVKFANGTVWDVATVANMVTWSGTTGADVMDGSDITDKLLGLAGNDTLVGNKGNDVLDGGAGNDYLYGGEGDDTYVFGKGSGQDVVDEFGCYPYYRSSTGGGIDTIQLSAGVLPSGVVVTRDRSGALYLTITGTTDKLTLTDWYGKGLIEQVKFADGTVWNEAALRAKVLAGTAGDDYQEGQDGADVITGQGGNDTLYGLKGNDTLNGGAGSDTLYGGQGNDTYVFERGAGQDLVIEEGGDDDAVQLGAGIAPSDVVLTRDQGSLYLSIKGTQDKLTLQGWFSQPYRVEQVKFANGTVWDVATVANMVTWSGTTGADVMIGSDLSDRLDGVAGNDCLYGGKGDDTYVFGKGSGQDVVDESGYHSYGNYKSSKGDGIDTIEFGAGVLPNDVLFQCGQDLVFTIAGATDTLTIKNWTYDQGFIEKVRFADGSMWDVRAKVLAGTTGHDYQMGTASADVITGLVGYDTLYGDAGNDRLDGGGDNDTLYGGFGDDTYVFGRGSGQDVVNESGYYAYNRLSYAEGYDTVQLGAGVAQSDVLLQRSENNLVLSILGTTDRLTLTNWYGNGRIEKVLFADGVAWSAETLSSKVSGNATSGDYRVGTSGGEVLMGAGGNDCLYGEAGHDYVYGSAGNDYLAGGDGDDIYDFGVGDGQDVVYDAGDGEDVVRFDASVVPNAVSVQRSGEDLVLSVEGTTDKLTLINWYGMDYYSDRRGLIELVQFSDGITWDEATLRAKVLAGTSSDDYQVGTETADVITGQAGNDRLFGEGGDDQLDGGAGNDAIFGYAGNDTLNGGAGSDTLYGGQGNDTYVFERGAGQDLVNDNGYGGTSYADVVQLGADIAPSDVVLARDQNNLYLSIKETQDKLTMEYWFSQTSYRIEQVKFANGTVWDVPTIASIVAPCSGTPAGESIWGSDVSDTLLGLGGDDRLMGQDGNDVLDGGTGNDYLYGHEGDDTYVFGKGSGQDVVDESKSISFPDGGFDTVQFGAGVVQTDVLVQKSGYDLLLSITGTTDTLRLRNWYNNGYTLGVIEQVKFANGDTWDVSALTGKANQSAPANAAMIQAKSLRLQDEFMFNVTSNQLSNPDTAPVYDDLTYSHAAQVFAALNGNRSQEMLRPQFAVI